MRSPAKGVWVTPSEVRILPIPPMYQTISSGFGVAGNVTAFQADVAGSIPVARPYDEANASLR